MSTIPSSTPPSPASRERTRERTLERRLFAWMLVLTLVPTLIVVAAGGWAVSRSLEVAGALGPWEDVAASGLRVVELAEPDADPALRDALAGHRAELSSSLTQARRWSFLGARLRAVLPWMTLVAALILAGLAAVASRRLARELARPIQELVLVADRMGAGEPLPDAPARTVREVRVLDAALRDAAGKLNEARERAVAAERLRVWGEMARRVAHEMKNPLTPLRLAAHRFGRAVVDRPELAEAVEVIEQEVGRLEELASQFSALGRPSEGPVTAVDVRELLASLLDTDVPPGVRAELHAPAQVPAVEARYDALLRAFRNLIRNAVDAMESTAAPRLDVTLAVTGVAPGGTGGAAGVAAQWLDVRIADNGIGLPPGPASRIFEPDFTTRTRGTGLGLALVRQAVEGTGGTVDAHDREQGAELRVRLPVRSPAVPAPSPEETG